MKDVDIISKVVGRKGEAMASPSKDAASFDLSGYLLKEVWDKCWEIRTTDKGEEYIFGKLPVALQYGLTSYVDGKMLDLPSIYDGLPIDYQTLYWEEVKEEAGTDEEGNPIYKTTKVLKAKGGGSGEGEGTASGEYLPLVGGKMTGDITFDFNSNKPIGSDAKPTFGLSWDGEYCKIYSDKTDHLTIRSINGLYIATNNNYYLEYAGGGVKINGGLISYDKTSTCFGLDSSLKMGSKSVYFGTGYVEGSQFMYIRDTRGISISTGYEKPLNLAVSEVNLYGGVFRYNPTGKYFEFDGNIVVTGGLTTFADSGEGNQWIMDAETLEEVTSDNEFKVYSAKVTSMIAASISDATNNASDAITKLAAIKTAFNNLSSSSSASTIGGALKTLANNL